MKTVLKIFTYEQISQKVMEKKTNKAKIIENHYSLFC